MRAKLLAVIAIISLLTVACKKDPVLSVDKESIAVTNDGGTYSFTVTSNVDWVVSGAKSWMKVNPSLGSGNAVVDIDVEPNKEVERRTCSLIVRTVDGQISNSIDISQSAAESLLKVNTNNLYLESLGGSAGELTITSNSDWELTPKVVDWLTFSSTSGSSGTTTIKISTRSENFSDEVRTVVATIKSATSKLEIEINQKPYLAPNCRVTIKNDVVMCDGAAGDLVLGSDARGYIEYVFPKNFVSTYTDKEIHQYLLEYGERWRYDETTNFFYTPGKLDANSEYVYCIVAYNADSFTGPLVKYAFKTRPVTNLYDATVSVTRKNGYWYYSTKMLDQCKRYYHWGWVDEDADDLNYFFANYSHAFLAYWLFNGMVEKDPEGYAINNVEKYYTDSASSKSCITVTWGLNDNLAFSSQFRYAYGSLSSSPAVLKSGSDERPAKPTRQECRELVKRAVRF